MPPWARSSPTGLKPRWRQATDDDGIVATRTPRARSSWEWEPACAMASNDSSAASAARTALWSATARIGATSVLPPSLYAAITRRASSAYSRADQTVNAPLDTVWTCGRTLYRQAAHIPRSGRPQPAQAVGTTTANASRSGPEKMSRRFTTPGSRTGSAGCGPAPHPWRTAAGLRVVRAVRGAPAASRSAPRDRFVAASHSPTAPAAPGRPRVLEDRAACSRP